MWLLHLPRTDGWAACLSDIYDEAAGEVFRYLRGRCGWTGLAEELTSATFVQTALPTSRDAVAEVSVGWLITVARNKLTDHWRREAMAGRELVLLEGGRIDTVDPWNAVLDEARDTDRSQLPLRGPHRHRSTRLPRQLP